MNTIEEVRVFLKEHLTETQVDEVIAAITAIRSDAYNEGWDDCESDG